MGFVVAGLDLRCHLFLYHYGTHNFIDCPLASHLPELLDIPIQAPTLAIAAVDTSTHRFIAVGFQNGKVFLTCTPLLLQGCGGTQGGSTRVFSFDTNAPIFSLCLARKSLRKDFLGDITAIALPAGILAAEHQKQDEEVRACIAANLSCDLGESSGGWKHRSECPVSRYC